jgi:hypothetical protein
MLEFLSGGPALAIKVKFPTSIVEYVQHDWALEGPDGTIYFFGREVSA